MSAVGDPVWVVLNDNYSRDREGYQKLAIIGETRVSWIVGIPGRAPEPRDTKIKKKDWPADGYYLTEATCFDAIWYSRNRYRIGEALRDYTGADKITVFHKVANLIGFVEPPAIKRVR